MTDPLVPRRPELARDPETVRVHARVLAGLFGDDEPGARFGRYEVRGKLGQGACGIVYEAKDDALERRVAIKLVRTEADTPLVRARLVREGQVLARVNHPNVVHVYEVGEDEGRVFVAMELVDGATLREWVRERPRPWVEVLDACIAAGRGLAAVHAQGLTHRDFKPDNVMVGDAHPGDERVAARVRVMDFGLARLLADGAASSETTITAKIAGTPAYMAPEQRLGEAVDARADQYSFCVTVWEALHGRRPTSSERARTRGPRRGVPRWIRAVLQRGLRADPTARWPDMAALLDALERGRAGTLRRRRVAAAAVLACTLGAVGVAYASDRVQRERECARAGDAIDDGTATEASAQTWRAASREACRRTVIDEVWDTNDRARADWCLERDRLRIVAGEPSAADECLEPGVLARISAPPAQHRGEARALAAALMRERSAGASDLAALAELVARADAIGFAALQSETRTLHAEALARGGELTAAEAGANAAYFVAARGDAWAEAAGAAALLAGIVGGASERAGEAEAWARHASVADVLAAVRVDR